MSKPSKTILITGGAGFVGSHLCAAYLEQGFLVICVDNVSTGSKHNVEKLLDNQNFSYYELDVCQPLPTKITNQNIDIIANLGSPASPPHYQRLAIETLQVGSLAMFNLLELTRQKNARFFQASTSEVYGDPEIHPQPETYKGSVNCYGPRSMYDESKRFAEAAIYSYRQKYNLNTCIARFFNTYGPNMDPDDGRVVSNFIVQALQGKPLTVYGDGSQTRSFCYVDDLVKGIMLLIDSNVTEPINLGNPGEFTILELAQLVQKMVGSTGDIVHHPLPGDDPMQRKPVINKAKDLLGWQPTVSLESGLTKTIPYFKEAIQAN